MKKNSLIIVGSGIKFMSHLTVEVKSCIEKSEKVLYLVNEPLMQEWLEKVNTSAESLEPLYKKYNSRNDNYILIANYIIENLEKFTTLCVVVYGHPSIFVSPSILAANKAIEKGYPVIFMPGISAEDCLFADLQIDPGACGCQSFEATDFLLYQREFDSSSHLILWQPFAIGVKGLLAENHDPIKGLQLLSDYLEGKYTRSHEIVIYEASQYPGLQPRIEKITLKDLPTANISRLSTLYVLPSYKKTPNNSILEKLNKL